MIARFLSRLLDLLTADVKPAARVVSYRNYSNGPFDTLEVA